jgi:uncharacterized membrane protein
MHRQKLLKLVDVEAVKGAIEKAEQETSGQIRVSVSPFFWGSVRRTAEKAFSRLDMTKTGQRNGVLIFVVPSRRRFVILGDEGIHQKVGQEFWDKTAAAISERFKSGDFTGGLVHGIEEAGKQLAAHFPRRPGDTNELPDDVDLGGKEK